MKIALQFSGGKDSLAVAYLFRSRWPEIVFYHLDTGDLLPEVRAIVDQMESMVPSFVRVSSDSAAWMDEHGLPSDLVPTTCTKAGIAIGASKQRIVDRFDCCASNIMAPLHYRMIEDGIDIVLRGTKRADLTLLPALSGDTSCGYKVELPLQDWSHEEVFSYLKEVGAPICRVYEHRVNAPECATCPAWWSEGRAEYLQKYHPDLYGVYHAKLARVAVEVTPLWHALQSEAGNG